jgi:uncharacterized protein (DUF2236 family)
MTRRISGDDYVAPSSLPLGPDTVAWVVSRDPVAFIGSSTALLLQVADPLVAAGVVQHSDYQHDPWSRLFRTFDTLLKMVFGDETMVRRMENRLAKRHAPVKGVSSDGIDYDARDPELAMWVWATLIRVAVDMYERVHGPLHPVDLQRNYDESKLFALGSGVPEKIIPPTWPEFLAWFDDYVARNLRATVESDDIWRYTMHPGTPPVVHHVLSLGLNTTAAAFLPQPAREVFGYDWNERLDLVVNGAMRAFGVVWRLVPRVLKDKPFEWAVENDLLAHMEAALARRRRSAARERSAA